jgi:two-component system LytT family response regulator
MIKAIIIDDELHCLESLKILLREFCPEVQVLEGCSSPESGLVAINTHNPDLVFLDIEMPVMNGFQMLEQVPAISFATIFTTSYDQYAIKAIRFSALDYLLKPVDPKELISSVKKVALGKHLPLAEQFQMLFQYHQGNEARFKKIAVSTLDGFELIPSDDIIRCEANDNYTHIFLKNKERIIASRTLKEIEEQLLRFTIFVRVHNSSLVNMNEISKYVRGEGGYLIMSDASIVNVSRRKKDELMKWL